MQIDKNTKIGKIIKHNPDALESIISINPIFEKLRNPVLRKLMANRTSIAMAAKVGNRTPSEFFDVLRPLGFAVDGSEDNEDTTPEKNIAPFKIDPKNVVIMDVRPILADGEDPFNKIQAKIKELKPGQILNIINTFEPSPLISMLNKKGYESYVKKLANNHYETFFHKKASENPVDPKAPEINYDGWQEAIDRFKGKTESIDVRQLEMPLPMTTILEVLDVIPEDKALYVFHKKIPMYLLPELSDKNYEFRIKEMGENEYHILIFKK
jgi:uncharacterized protein (DUF2249 family)